MEVSDIAVLVTHTSSASSSAPSTLGSLSQTQTHQTVESKDPHSFQQKQAADSLIQVIQKLSKIVEKRPQGCCSLARQKRRLHQASSKAGGEEVSGGASPNGKTRRTCIEEESVKSVSLDNSTDDRALSPSASGDRNNNIATTVTEIADNLSSCEHKRTVTCYQCSLCPYLSPTLTQLKEHLKQHNEQHSDLILMCSECRFTSRDQEQLEAHVRLHFDSNSSTLRNNHGGEYSDSVKSGADGSTELSQGKKWYSYEEYGLYRCLICSYVCGQQRMLKTHAWKHAGLVDCSYPIFEDEEGTPARREAQTSQPTGPSANTASTREELVVLSPVLQDKSLQKIPSAFKLQLCVPLVVDKQDAATQSVSKSLKVEEEERKYPIKDLATDEPMVEVQVTDAESEVDNVVHHDNTSDSLLSSAHKIINRSPNSAGHINVIVERLPSAEDSVMATNPLLLNPDVDEDKSLLNVQEREHEVKDEVDSDVASFADSQSSVDSNASMTTSADLPRDENIPPTARKRTHSESLRLHSLAAEALVTMPMRTPALPNCSSKVSPRTVIAQTQTANPAQELMDEAADGKTGALLDLGLKSKREQSLRSLGFGEGDEESPGTKAGISLSLLTVIERLRERSDQNTSDEDILKELQDNAQFQNGAVGSMVTGNGSGSYTCNVDGLGASPDNSLVDYIHGSERPYRCRLCQYSSGNKGYIKQHLRVHKQRQPYQCPICEHVASDSEDLESHMIHHCKTRMYQCKQCPEAFHYKCQLRTHEREHHSPTDEALTPVTESVPTVEEADQVTDEESSVQKMYKCDVCDYTSATYVGVRNHRRIHNSDKPYRCCSCDFATTNMNSLKSHMRRHPQEHQAVQLLEQYRCSLCGYVCSHPPSLKSHMWKHAGDQNYNYEQVNKAINEAISQSSRAPQKLSGALESVSDRPTPGSHPSKDKVKGSVELLPTPSSTAGLSVDVSAVPTDQSQGARESLSPQGKDPPQLRTDQAHGMEYCLLLFCCCICGFESTSKERLIEHMKEHEGDLISIILNKEQQQPEPQTSLQTAE